MRQVGGLDRPVVQWLFVALGVGLVVVAAGEAIGLRRNRAQIEALRGADLNGRIERQQLEARLSRERAARESLSLQLARVGGAPHAAAVPALTLAPLKKRGATPPLPTVAIPAPAQTIELHLMLDAVPQDAKVYAVTLRRWSEGAVVWSRHGLSASTLEGRPMVAALITGDVLAAGAYELALTADGATNIEIASYELSVGSPPR